MLNFLKDFLKRDGIYVFISSIISKFSNIILSFFIVRFLSKEEFGSFSYVQNIILLVIPFAGFGGNLSLLRFGAINNSNLAKYYLFQYSLRFGSIISIIQIIALLIFAVLLTSYQNKLELLPLFIVLSFQILTKYWYDCIQSFSRVIKLNKLFSTTNISYAFILLILSIILTYWLKSVGFALAYVITPLIIVLYFSRKKIIKNSLTSKNNQFSKKKEFWKYGIHVGIGSFISQLVLSIDFLIIGLIFTTSNELAEYKIATIIPLNLLFFPQIMFQTDFVFLAENSTNKNEVKKYYKNYLKLFIPFSMLLVITTFFFDKQILHILFGQQYENSAIYLKILMIGAIGSLLFRSPLGNMLGAFGYGKFSSNISILILLFSIITNIFLIEILQLGIIAVAITSTISIWLAGFLSLLKFKTHIKTL